MIRLKEVNQILGDIAVSLGNAYNNAQSIGHNLDREVCFLLIHGILHLCGHDHHEEAEEALMMKQQKKILERIATIENSPLWENCVRYDDDLMEAANKIR